MASRLLICHGNRSGPDGASYLGCSGDSRSLRLKGLCAHYAADNLWYGRRWKGEWIQGIDVGAGARRCALWVRQDTKISAYYFGAPDELVNEMTRKRLEEMEDVDLKQLTEQLWRWHDEALRELLKRGHVVAKLQK